jgi:hypothetical protein
MSSKRCFVISPIGPEGSAIREHMDDVFDFIIAPAMQQCDIEPVRADRLSEPGRISEMMFQHIFDDDLCIAVLTGHNPNVFYELALAQAAAKPVILMMEKGGTMPFDIHDSRCIDYDLRPRTIHNAVFVKELVEHVRAIGRNGWTGSFPFGNRTPLGQTTQLLQAIAMSERTIDLRTPDKYLSLLAEARKSFSIIGYSLTSWGRVHRVRSQLREKAQSGCHIRIAIMDSEHPMLRHLLGLNDQGTMAQMRQDIMNMTGLFNEIAAGCENIEFRTVKAGCIHARLHITDSRALYDPYFFGEANDFTPIWEAENSTGLYALCIREFDSLWEINAPAASPS